MIVLCGYSKHFIHLIYIVPIQLFIKQYNEIHLDRANNVNETFKRGIKNEILKAI